MTKGRASAGLATVPRHAGTGGMAIHFKGYDTVSLGESMDETELIAAARLGNEDAFAELYRQHVGYVRAIGRSILRNKDLDDMCQDTFLLAFTRLNSFDGNSRFRTWITRIAINRCLVTLRKGRRTGKSQSDQVSMDTEFADEGVDRFAFACIDQQLEGLSTRLDLEKLLSALTPIQRQILEMAYLEDMPELEIAEVLGIPLSAVTRRIFRAKRKVRNKCTKG
jgi:RNA polymerase sigma-70 factor (ECF subfamily)